MSKPTNRERMLTEGLRVMHERGYLGASVRDIANAAGAPLGSFTNHFSSKEAFSLEVLNRYCNSNAQMINDTLLNQSLKPLDRVSRYIDSILSEIGRNGCWNGCLIGNFCAEATEHSELIRERLIEIFADLKRIMADCLMSAVTANELPLTTDCAELAAFIITSLQGSILQSKAERSAEPVQRFKRILFSTIFR